MTEVKMSHDWFMSIDVDQMINWMNNSEIVDWYIKGSVSSFAEDPVLIFESSEDAVAFRLRFGAYVL